MRKLNRVQGGGRQRIRASDINDTRAEVESARIRGVGPGLAMFTGSGGTHIAFIPTATSTPSGDMSELAHVQGTQDTDSWERGDEGVSVTVATDIRYDTSTYQLTYRTRTFEFDRDGRLKSISAESEPVLVTQAGECT